MIIKFQILQSKSNQRTTPFKHMLRVCACVGGSGEKEQNITRKEIIIQHSYRTSIKQKQESFDWWKGPRMNPHYFVFLSLVTSLHYTHCRCGSKYMEKIRLKTMSLAKILMKRTKRQTQEINWKIRRVERYSIYVLQNKETTFASDIIKLKNDVHCGKKATNLL